MTSDIGPALIQEAARLLRDDFLPRIRGSLQHLSEADVWWRPNQNSNSVGNLILHLDGNVRQWIISGLGGGEDRRKRPSEFQTREGMTRSQLLERLDKTVTQAAEILLQLSPALLSEDLQIQGHRVSRLQALLHVVEHFSHHTGQIILLAKQLADVDLGFYAYLDDEREGEEEQI